MNGRHQPPRNVYVAMLTRPGRNPTPLAEAYGYTLRQAAEVLAAMPELDYAEAVTISIDPSRVAPE